MTIRITESYSIFAFMWGFITILRLLTYNVRYPFPWYAGISLIIAGISLGIIDNIIHIKRWLNSLEQKGEFKDSINQVLIRIGLILVFGGIVFLFIYQISIWMFTVFFDFLLPFLTASYATQAFLLKRWEKKHNKIILQGTWGGKIYASPYP